MSAIYISYLFILSHYVKGSNAAHAPTAPTALPARTSYPAPTPFYVSISISISIYLYLNICPPCILFILFLKGLQRSPTPPPSLPTPPPGPCPPSFHAFALSKPAPFQGAPQGSPLRKLQATWWILKEADSQIEGGKENDRHGARDRETEAGERSNGPLQVVFRLTPKTGVGASSPLATRKPPFLGNKQQAGTSSFKESVSEEKKDTAIAPHSYFNSSQMLRLFFS